MINQKRTQGHFVPRKQGGTMVSPVMQYKDQLLAIFDRHSDASLAQYCELLFDETGLWVSQSTMCRTFQGLNLPRKKRRFAPAKPPVIAPTTEDQVYFLGDLIDRGPASAQVVEFVRQSPYTCLLGNHELLMLEAFPKNQVFDPGLQAWLYSGGRETVISYGDQGISVEHLNWMRSLPTHLDLGDVWLVHAGVHPTLPIEAQTEQEFCWIRGEFHRLDHPYFRDKLIITGHTITFTLPGVEPGQIAQGNGWLDIDTGAYHPKSGWMTGLDLTNRMVYQVNVFMGTMRTLPLEAAVDRVELGRIKTHY